MSERSRVSWCTASLVVIGAMAIGYAVGGHDGRAHQPRTVLVIPSGCQRETFKDGGVFWLCLGPER